MKSQITLDQFFEGEATPLPPPPRHACKWWGRIAEKFKKTFSITPVHVRCYEEPVNTIIRHEPVIIWFEVKGRYRGKVEATIRFYAYPSTMLTSFEFRRRQDEERGGYLKQSEWDAVYDLAERFGEVHVNLRQRTVTIPSIGAMEVSDAVQCGKRINCLKEMAERFEKYFTYNLIFKGLVEAVKKKCRVAEEKLLSIKYMLCLLETDCNRQICR